MSNPSEPKRPHTLSAAEIYAQVLGIPVGGSDTEMATELSRGFVEPAAHRAPSWIRIPGGGPLEAEDVGTKAAGLARLEGLGLGGPAWLVIGTGKLEEFLKLDAELSELLAAVSKSSINKFNLFGAAEALQLAILARRIPPDWLQQIETALEAAGIEFPLAVRSSALVEDLPGNSFAGVYRTSLNVGRGDLEQAILTTWASLFSKSALLLRADANQDLHAKTVDFADTKMGVLLQRMHQADLYGVAFTADPLSGNRAVAVIETSKGPGALVDGSGDSEQVVIDRITWQIARDHDIADYETESALPDATAVEIARDCARVEEALGTPVDVEFGLEGTAPVYLQARPMVLQDAADAVSDRNLVFIPPEAVDAETDILYFDCAGLNAAYNRKKYPLRRMALRYGVRLPKWYWLEYDAVSLEARPDLFTGLFDAEELWLDVSSNFRGILVGRNELHGYLGDLVRRHPRGRMTVLIRESFDTEIGAISAMQSGNAVMVEYAEGILKGVLNGIAESSKISVAGDGSVTEVRIAEQRNGVRIDEVAKKSVTYSIDPPRQVRMADLTAREIAGWTRSICSEDPSSRPEWWIIGDKPYLFDVSNDEDGKQDILASPSIVSPGEAEGAALVLTDLSGLESLGEGWAVSIAGLNDELRRIEGVRKISERLDALGSGPKIIVAPRSHVGLIPFIDEVVGYVFDDASLLSHLSIVLRQRGVPAIIEPMATKTVQEGQRVAICSDGLFSNLP